MFLIQILVFSLLLLSIVWMASGVFYHFDKKGKAELPVSLPAAVDTRPVVILDAGHGGMDSGAVSVFGDEEKHINLAVTQKLGEFLSQSGIRVIFTRSDDTMLESNKTTSRKMADLIARVDVAKENPNATFVSIHMNTLPVEKYSGLQAFYSQNNDRSKVLALQVQNDTVRLLQPQNNRKAKDAQGSIYILDRIQNPAVLIECGFLSNREEAGLLINDEYQQKLAFAISRSVIDFVMQQENLELF